MILSSLTRRKTDLFGICCVFGFLENCEGPTEIGYSSCDALLRSTGLVVAQWLVFFAVVAANVLFVVVRFKKHRNENSKTLLTLAVNLCLAYMIGALGVLVTVCAAAHYNGREDFLLNHYNWWVDSAWCSLAGVLHAASSQASVLFMLLICLERCFSIIISPNSSSGWRIGVYVACPVAWLISFALASVPLIASFQDDYYSWSALCVPMYAQMDTPVPMEGWQYSFGVFCVVDLLLLLAPVVLYAVLWCGRPDFTEEQDGDVLSRTFEFDKLKTVLPAAALDWLLCLPLIGLSLLGPTGKTSSRIC